MAGKNVTIGLDMHIVRACKAPLKRCMMPGKIYPLQGFGQASLSADCHYPFECVFSCTNIIFYVSYVIWICNINRRQGPVFPMDFLCSLKILLEIAHIVSIDNAGDLYSYSAVKIGHIENILSAFKVLAPSRCCLRRRARVEADIQRTGGKSGTNS